MVVQEREGEGWGGGVEQGGIDGCAHVKRYGEKVRKGAPSRTRDWRWFHLSRPEQQNALPWMGGVEFSDEQGTRLCAFGRRGG